MKGVVLAAGKGSRLFPVTHVVPKPLLPLANRVTLDLAFEKLREIGVTEVGIVVGENRKIMADALGDGKEYGVKLTYIHQPDPQGLAHAVSFAKPFVGNDSFILYLGDAVYSDSLAPFRQRFEASGCDNLNLVKPVPDPERFGVAETDGERILRLVEKPKEPKSNLAMAGVYFFGSKIWAAIDGLQPSARGEYEITDAIQRLIDTGGNVLAGVYEGDWFDTGTLDSFLGTNAHLLAGAKSVDPSAVVKGEVGTNVAIGAGAQVSAARIEDAVILPWSVVDCAGEIRHSLLGGKVTGDEFVNAIRHGDRQP